MSIQNDDIEERKKLFTELKNELFKRQLSNSENLDKAILAYSSAGLGLSLGFLKDFIPLGSTTHEWLLVSSWILFLLAISFTIVSFFTSQSGIDKQLELGERYYLKYEEKAFNEKNHWASTTAKLAFLAAVAFIIALLCTTLFIAFNIQEKVQMSPKKSIGAPIPKLQPASITPTDSKTIPNPHPLSASQPSIGEPNSGAAKSDAHSDNQNSSHTKKP